MKKELEGEPKLEVIGAGWGRTGTNSVKLALEKLLDGPCYHMCLGRRVLQGEKVSVRCLTLDFSIEAVRLKAKKIQKWSGPVIL